MVEKTIPFAKRKTSITQCCNQYAIFDPFLKESWCSNCGKLNPLTFTARELHDLKLWGKQVLSIVPIERYKALELAEQLRNPAYRNLFEWVKSVLKSKPRVIYAKT